MLNKLLGGHYRVIRNLGEGGLAKTYIAEDLHRPGHPKCAVKFLQPANKDPNFLPSARRLFHQEAEILEKLGQHDQIPRLLAYFEENQEFYLVQEFIEGNTLCKEMKPGQRWSESKVIQMLQDALPVLEFVHSHKVIHRDLKPNNMIRRHKDGRLVLIDFGAVKQIRAPRTIANMPLTQTTISIGTQGYTPTEQLRGKPRFNSDIYALGMICIQALTGVAPLRLREDKHGEVIWQNLVQVSDELAIIISNMVRYHFPNRYQSATEVLQALQTLVNQNPLISATLITKQVKQKAEPQEEERSSLAFPTDSFTSSKNLPSIHANKVVHDTEVDQALQASQRLFNHDQLIPATSVARQGSQKVAPKKQKRNGLVLPANLPAPSTNLQSIHTPIFVPLNKSLLLIGAGIVSVFASIFASYTYMTHKDNNLLRAQSALGQIEVLKEAEKYQECLQLAQTFLQDYSRLHREVQKLQSRCQEGQIQRQLIEARKLAQQSRFRDAIILTSQVSANSDFYPEAQQLISRWSEEIFQIASNKYQEGNLKEAVAIAGAIPNFSPWAKKAQETIQQWNKDWAKNQAHLQTAQKALDERRWQDAIKAAKKISYTPYWQKQSELIIQKAKAGIARTQAAASRKTYQPRSRPVRRSRSGASRSRSVRRSRSRSTRSSVSSTKSPSTSIKSRSISIKSPSNSPTQSGSSSSSTGSRSNSWTCLNNPSPKCGR